MSAKKNNHTLLKVTMAAAGIGAAAAYGAARAAGRNEKNSVPAGENKTTKDNEVYFVGGGLGSLAGAAYLIRDAGFDGKRIHILEGMPVLGGSNDGSGTPAEGFVCRGGRMLNEETYENFWELFSSIPSVILQGFNTSR